MQFPRFNGNNPGIWRDKCEDYFQLFNLPESMWTTLAWLHMDEVPSKWWKVCKLKHGVEQWSQFIKAVEQKFGAHEYREAIEELLELQQTDTVEQYVNAFEHLQFQITMHNTDWDEVLGLKSDIRGVVQAQDPTTMDRAISL